MRRLYPFCALALLSACSPNSAQPDANSSAALKPVQMNEARFRDDIKNLSSDEFEGRAPTTQGEKLTLDYLSKAFAEMGLKGAYQGSFLQPVPMVSYTADEAQQVTLAGLPFKYRQDLVLSSRHDNGGINIENAPLVFVGYGVNAPEYGWNDYQDVDMKGKIAVILVNDPGFARPDSGKFNGKAMTYYGRWTYKYEEAARQGAEAVFIVHETEPAAYGWGVVQNSNTGTKFTLIDVNNNQGQVGVMGWVQHDVAKKIFAKAGMDFDTLKQQAAKPNFKAIPLKLKANVSLNNTIERAESHNVAALLPGKSRPDEVVMMHAHWDHLGTVIEDGKPEIINGAVDNASGVAGVLALARYFAKQAKTAPLERSILFSAFTAEETGLIGAQHFAQHPSVPTKNIVAFLNIDGMNMNQGVDYILRYGEGVSELEGYLDKAAKAQGRVVKADPRPQNGLMFRSDHFALAQQGVPGLLFMSLGDTDPDYIAHKYHKGADDYDPNWSLEGVKQDLDLMANMLTTLANGKDWPHWLEASDFKTKREQDGRKK